MDEAVALSCRGVFLLFLVSVLLAHLLLVLVDERLLTERLGSSYEECVSGVPRWMLRVPRGEKP